MALSSRLGKGASSALRVLTWNLGRPHIRGWRGWPGWRGRGRFLDWAGDSRLSDDDLARVVRAILRLEVDVVALQELADVHQLRRISSALGEAWRGVLGTPEGFDRHTAILARRDHLQGIATVTTATGRAAAAALVAARPGGPTELAIASVHLDAFHPETRASQVAELVAWADARAEPHVILAGDLNLDFDHRALHRPVDAATIDRLRARFLDVGRASGPTALLGRRLDYVLVRAPSRLPGEALVHHALRLPLGDHLPLTATLLL